MVLVNVMQTCAVTEKTICELVNSSFAAERICCLLRYGPSSSATGAPPSDYDFLLLLDSPQPADYACVRKLSTHKLPIEIFIEYRDHIELRGIANYRRGCHGTYFVAILATAACLLGENYYAHQLPLLSPNTMKADLLDRIEEYFYRLQKMVLNNERLETASLLKYFARIVTDLLLYAGELQYSDMHTCHFTDIIEGKLPASHTFTADDVKEIRGTFELKNATLSECVTTMTILNQAYETLISTHSCEKLM
jgi:hypothetical protein